MRGILVNVIGNVDDDIQADHINRAEGRRSGPTNDWARHSIDFFNRESALPHQCDGLQRRKQADAIRDEIGSVFRTHNAFSQHHFGEPLKFGKRLRIGLRRCNDFEQLHISRRIEEVRAKPVAPEIITVIFGQRCDRKPGCVGCHKRPWSASGVDSRQQLLLNRGFFNDSFDNPVGFLDTSQVLIKIAYANPPDVLRHEKRRRRTVLQRSQSGLSLFGGHIQQEHGYSGVCQVCGDLRAHRARAKYCRFLDHQ